MQNLSTDNQLNAAWLARGLQTHCDVRAGSDVIGTLQSIWLEQYMPGTCGVDTVDDRDTAETIQRKVETLGAAAFNRSKLFIRDHGGKEFLTRVSLSEANLLLEGDGRVVGFRDKTEATNAVVENQDGIKACGIEA